MRRFAIGRSDHASSHWAGSTGGRYADGDKLARIADPRATDFGIALERGYGCQIGVFDVQYQAFPEDIRVKCCPVPFAVRFPAFLLMC